MSNEKTSKSDAETSNESYSYEALDNQRKARRAGESENWKPSRPHNPHYIGFLRFLGGVNFIVGGIAFLVFLVSVVYVLKEPSYREPNHFVWLAALALTIEGFIAYGLLNAIADIARNMIDIGDYIRHSSAVEKKLLEEKGKLENIK